MKKQKLHLRRETVRTLSARGLRAAVGGLIASGNAGCVGYSDGDDCSVGCGDTGGGGAGTYAGCVSVGYTGCTTCQDTVSSRLKLGNNYGC
jgi:hypothetical protein